MLKKKLLVQNKLGLHARASSKLIKQAACYQSDVHIACGEKTANGKNIMEVMMLAASQGAVIELIISGPDEEAAMAALETLINHRFGEQ